MGEEGCEMVGFFGFDRGIRILDQPDGLGATSARMSRVPGLWMNQWKLFHLRINGVFEGYKRCK